MSRNVAQKCRRCTEYLLVLCGVAVLAADGRGEPPLPPAAPRTVDFSRQIAPLLRTHCLACHDPVKHKGGLRLDTRAGLLKGSYSGEVVQLGKGRDSLLIQLVAGTAPDGAIMPPKGQRLRAAEVALLRAWIDQGAVWPKDIVLTPKDGPALAKERHWAFQPIRRPAPPTVKRRDWVRNPIDRFILSRLEAENVQPSPEADRATLLRRVTLDLIGLPPAPAEVTAFVKDRRPDAYERLVDRLLASSHYGEKQAQPWLDLCHYADTNGYLQDLPRPVAWRYRQWLIDALNRDLPFDQFTREQLAGDLLANATIEQRLGTGFLRNTLSNREGGADLEEYRVEQIVDRTRMVGTAWLGLTVGCARCHDHKYDPLSQKEFYQLYAFFDSADEINIDAPLPGETERQCARRPEYERKRAELLKPVAKEVAELQSLWEKKLREAADNPEKDALWYRQWEVLGLVWGQDEGEGQLEGTEVLQIDPAQRMQDQKDRLLDYFLSNGSLIDPPRFKELKLAELSKKLNELKATLPKITRAPTMHEGPQPRQTYLHVRGDFRSRGIRVQPGTPAFLPPRRGDAGPNRLALVQWLLDAENPLTARVTVNRFWQEFFGRGLVLTSEDFGLRGEKPTHPELLDWLAVEFRARGWSMKSIHRLIVTSAAYRQSSRARPELFSRDPNNRLLARQESLRLSADQVRDTTLAVSGLLSRQVGGPSVFPPQPESVTVQAYQNKWTTSQGGDRYRRGLYTFAQRLAPFAQSVTFDAPATTHICTRRERSNTPLQALTLLNDPIFSEAAQSFAARVLRETNGSVEDRIEHAFRLALGRPPEPREKARLRAYYQRQRALLADEPCAAAAMFPGKIEGIDPIEGGAWTGVCSILLNLHEFITRD